MGPCSRRATSTACARREGFLTGEYAGDRGRMRRAAAVDANQPSVVDTLRRAGCVVECLHSVGGGVPDLLVGRRGVVYLLEVKDGSKPPSKQALTDDQK